MLPMWMLSGIFFSSSRYPDAAQPLIKMLPLTALIDAMRAVMIDGASIFSQNTPDGVARRLGNRNVRRRTQDLPLAVTEQNPSSPKCQV